MRRSVDGTRAADPPRCCGGRGKAVLTIGETTSFLREGGIVRVFRDEDCLRLQINNKSAEDVGLQISSRLLQLAARTP